MLHQRHNAAGSGSSLQAPSTTITGRSRFSKALPSVPLNLPLRDFAAPRPLPKDLPDLPPAPPPPPSDTNEHRDDDDARSIKTIKSTKSVIARKPVSSSPSASSLPPAPPPKAAARVLRSPTASNTSPGTPSSSLSSHTTSPPATAMAIPRRPVGSGGPGAGTKKVTPKASTSSISTTRTSARTTSNASASTVTVARTSTSTTNTTAGTTSSNANGYTNGNGNNASGGGNGNGHGNSSSGLHPTAASPLDPAQPSPTDSISSLLSAYSREPELLQPPAGSNTAANANGGPHESKVPGAWPAAVPTSPPGSGFQFPAPPGRAGMSAAAETPVTGPSAAAAAAAATSSSSSNKSKSDRAQANGIGAAVQVGGAAGSGTDASIVKQPASIGHGSGNGTSSGTNRGNGSGSTSTGTSTSTNGAPGSTGLAAAGGSVATAARQHSPQRDRVLPPPPPPSKDEKALPQRPPPSPNAFPSSSAAAATTPNSAASKPPQPASSDLPTPSPPRTELWRRRPHKSEASRELPGLKLDHSHGSTAATAPLPQPPPAVDTSSAGSGPGEQPKSSQDTIRAVTSPSSSPSRVSPPRPSAVIGLPGRNVRPAAKLHKQQTQDTQQTQHHDQVAASQAMGNGESKLNRIKGSLQKQQHRLRKPSSSSPDKDAANGASKRDQNGPRLAALRPPTPEYHKEDVKSAPAATDTFVSPASPASSSPSPVSLPADSTKALPPQLPTQSARTGLTPSAPSIHGTASLQELNSSAQSPAGSRRASPATDGASSRTRESAESTKFPPRTSSTKQNWQKSVEPLRRSAGDGDPRIVLSDTQGPLYRGRDGTLYPEMKITREFDPKVAYFPTQKAKPLEPGAVIPARPLQESHFGCYQSHRSMNRRSNRHYPLTCQTCDKADSEDRWVCTFCHLRICESCLRALNGHQRVLRRLVDELATNTPLSLSSMSRPGSALGIQAAT
ncbi:hypothetical protein VFPFJ_05510 [Purpureocillium lilacinum]|uniref:Uncharacterized protein n=1 Tax=Purpureocillium lilacinum TaxID=33203 RepID=A0A179H2U6_PURLI|nr:hypothetical protein VFPFJ_05510 [Purpureocillium lilacinum]OAQ84565.1 hypothetical protein VFPBJ_03333 [Purpureocillium lilacinum]OAQ89101.1 hypothetical protein VFPFJ_05510 [Purpureocillium lilacinum]GJN77489.1 hypothetical protein PLIIFM63780_000980 [Purpureocillium lilacinum]